ncbi:UBA/THIF-type NAD/FAD binding fold protein [Deinococcus geothermalis DSM 11300]|uniref:UBA/THIF-type NAD/FAD binding fold protein n=1 Tax=Deinococcus geothermalis (strain DSM 11300 / CIP 105573 / AG-3a) TaxID=319795 RepID=Q1J205_DEIGD|nr:HesA/MoeB/ThiF family protein [Deinococcus geothermalis]ABF44479.1 UBA/THIF-type NAD/FAD binding fold protein [Deinococcus geothermalis DSM 11300]
MTPSLSRTELRRYSRQLLVPEWQGAGAQERVRGAAVLVVGAGGLGGPVILQLAGAGVGRLVIADGDTVDLSNLHRQTQFSLADVGRPKAEVAAARAQALNPFVRVEVAPRLDAGNADTLLAGVDLIVDATDNFEARYAIADACGRAQREWVWGAASGTSGLVSVFGPDLGLRDVFPDPGDAASCDEAGVLGPLPNVVGGVMALEALKLLGGVGEPLRGRLWTFDALSGRVRVLHLRGTGGQVGGRA